MIAESHMKEMRSKEDDTEVLAYGTDSGAIHDRTVVLSEAIRFPYRPCL